ncbi:MAG: hypothetical protein AAF597_01575, partial [Bacteroidota bacterium]
MKNHLLIRPEWAATRQLIILLALLATSSQLLAQDFTFPAPVERIYPISANTTRAILQGELKLDSLSDPGTPYPVNTKPEALPPGHYLTARLNGPQVHYAYFNTYQYQVEVQPGVGCT